MRGRGGVAFACRLLCSARFGAVWYAPDTHDKQREPQNKKGGERGASVGATHASSTQRIVPEHTNAHISNTNALEHAELTQRRRQERHAHPRGECTSIEKQEDKHEKKREIT